MEKMTIENSVSFLPMAMVLVGSLVEGKANFMAVAWVSAVNRKPPLISIALGPHYTNKGIEANQEFSINVPSVNLAEETDYCGCVSGSKVDKSGVFELFYGKLKTAPLIKECPLNIACKVYQTLTLPSNTVFIGEIIETFAEERHLTDQQPDMLKMSPFTLTMPDKNYREIGKDIGRAWQIGKNLKERG
jgi:flavin reductase (DIM6/NTAB) family NADH-FMN oxidoreductase RutF